MPMQNYAHAVIDLEICPGCFNFLLGRTCALLISSLFQGHPELRKCLRWAHWKVQVATTNLFCSGLNSFLSPVS